MDNESNIVGQSVEGCVNSDEVNNTNATSVFVEENMECSDITGLETEELNRKRARTRDESSSEEGWNTISRGRKVIRRSSQEVEDKVQVYVTCNSALPKQFALARLFRDGNINGISRVKYVHQYKILITFDQEVDADRLIQCKTFCDLGWRCQKTTEVGLSYGVIKNIDLELAEEDIIKNLSCDIEMISAKRLKKRKYNEDDAVGWENCEAIRLAFKGASLPTHVFIYGMRVKVDPYVFPVTQCSRCWKFGHTKLLCPSKKVVCPKCTKSHDNCKKTVFRCVNCTGSHMALEKVCPVYKKERRIRELMSEFNCTYRKALTIYVPPSPIPDRYLSPGPAFIAVLNPEPTHRAPEPVYEETIQPARKEKLMSELFAAPEHNSFKLVQNRKQKRQRKQRAAPTPGPSPAPSPAPLAMETDWNKDSECSEDYTHGNSETPNNSRKTNARLGGAVPSDTKDLSFIRLLIRLYKIVVSRDPLESKIQHVVSICKEWILSNVVSGISAGSLLNFFVNDG